MAIYDSKREELLDYCETEWFQIGKDHPKLDESLSYGVGVINVTKDVLIRVEGCEGYKGIDDSSTKTNNMKPSAMIGGKGLEAS